MLTAIKINNAKKQAKPYKLHDERGLFLLIQPNGAKYWRFKYRYGGKEKLLSFGTYPDTELKAARQRRDSARKLIAEGLDPSQARKDDKAKQKSSIADTFESVVREWHEVKKGGWTKKHAANVLQSIDDNAIPYLGNKPVSAITKGDILDVLRRMEDREALETAARVRQRLRDIFRYAIGTDRAQHNPVSEIDITVLKALKPVRHFSTISKTELPEFLEKVKAYDGHPVTKAALKLILLTFVRTTELRSAEWNEFDLKGAIWNIPAEHTKKRRAHIVPLSKQALDILEELKPLTGDGRYLFPSFRGKKGIMSENTILFAIYRMGYHSKMTGHGVRALASTLLNEMGFNADVVERQLAHVEENKVRAAYNRADYLEDRKKMMQHWADYLDGCAVQNANVIQVAFGVTK